MVPATIVVPCFNEADRLDEGVFLDFARRPGVRLLMVDDGSKDKTSEIMARMASACDAVGVLVLPENRGKAEAVRQGMRLALEQGALAVGYFDADLSTPPDECVRLIGELDDEGAQVILASRVAMLGTHIDRQTVRHYFSRVFATGASIVLRCAVYDTQCGAKVFRRSSALDAALDAPFSSRWAFDVELIGRLLIGAPGVPGVPIEAIREVPLRRWTHVPGSKLHVAAMLRAAAELTTIAWALEERKRRVKAQISQHTAC
jgi:glycosyltransferase involved in cell wall biosynthesis